MDESARFKRIISDTKVNKNEEIRINWIRRQVTRYSSELTEDLKHNALLIGDSKLRHLENEMTNKTHVMSFWRSGATLENPALRKHVDRHISKYNKPIVICLFNTCYLTSVSDRIRKYIEITQNSDDIVNFIIEQYTQFKQERLYRRPSAKIIFIECPYYSIIEWNRIKKHPNPKAFTEQQERLEMMITELNTRIRELNEPENPPEISRDMIFKIKKEPS